MPEDLSGLNDVIIDHPDAAQYFQQIFQHDWDHLAKQKARSD